VRVQNQSAKISWEGDSLQVIRSFPEDVRKDLGAALRKIQLGQIPMNIRPMQSIGKGVFEIKEQDSRTWYRVIYLSKIADAIHVLHCFEKTSAKTSKLDLEKAGSRLRLVYERIREERRYEKRQKK
jgi:phage-related protein